MSFIILHCIFRIVHDREVQLYDGTRLIRHDSYDKMISSGRNVDELAQNGIFRIHPSFRIVALAEKPSRKLLISITLPLLSKKLELLEQQKLWLKIFFMQKKHFYFKGRVLDI